MAEPTIFVCLEANPTWSNGSFFCPERYWMESHSVFSPAPVFNIQAQSGVVSGTGVWSRRAGAREDGRSDLGQVLKGKCAWIWRGREPSPSNLKEVTPLPCKRLRVINVPGDVSEMEFMKTQRQKKDPWYF